MPLDFSPIAEKLPEGVSAEMLAAPAIQDFIKSFTDSSVDTATQGLKRNNQALKDEKTELKNHLDQYKDVDLDEFSRLKELSNNDIDLEEYASLKKFREDNADSSKQIDGLRQQIKSIETAHKDALEASRMETENAGKLLLNERRSNQISSGIQEHNANLGQVGLIPGNERWIQQEAESVWQYQEGQEGQEGRFVAMQGDQLIPGEDGKPISMSEWVNTLRDKPNFKNMYMQPSGGGAGGGSPGSLGADKSKLLGSKSESASAVAGMFPDLPRSA